MTNPYPVDKIQAQERKERKMTQYRILSSEDGSSVEMLTNKGWQGVVHFTSENHIAMANRWVSNQMRLDRLDNA